MNTTTNPNHSSITFYCPNHLKTSFDELVKFKRISRTSIINNLMENYIRTEYKLMEEDNKIVSFINDLKVRTHKNKVPKLNKMKEEPKTKWSSNNDDYEPPMIPTLDDNDLSKDDWSDISGLNRFWSLK